MPKLNELTLSELTVLHHRIGVLCEAGRSLNAANLGPVFDLTPGAPIAIYTNAVMPGAADHGQPVQFSMEVTGLDDGDEAGGGRTIAEWLSIFDGAFAEYQAGFHTMQTQFGEAIKMLEEALQPPQMIISGEVHDMAALITKTHVRVFEHDVGIDMPSFQKRESTEAPPTSPASEPVEPPPALGEVVGGGAPAVDQPGPPAGAEISAEPSRSDEASPSVEAEAESGGGVEVAAPEAPAATDADAKAEKWTQTEDAALVHLIVQGIMDEGLSRRAAIISAARQIGRPEPGTLWRVAKILKGKLDDALTAAAFEQAATKAPEFPPAEVAVASVPRDAAAGGHSPEAVQEIAPEALDQTFDRPVDAIPDLHGEDLRVWQWVAAHRPKWPHTAGTDLDLAVGLGRGEKLNLIALDLGIDVKKLQERWDCLSRPIRNAQDKVTLDGMPRLIKILRLIAKAPAAAA